MTFDISERELNKLYSKDLLILDEIGDLFGVCSETVSRKLKEYNIPLIYTPREPLREKLKSVTIDRQLKNYIDGLIVGDGCIGNEKNPRYKQGACKERVEWLYYIKSFFESNGIHSSLVTAENNGYINGLSYQLQTYSYPQFKIFRERWYPNGNKRIPNDIELTSQFLANWYMGDGSYSDYQGRKKLQFHVECFPEDNVADFVEVLNKFGLLFRVSHKKGKPVITLNYQDDISDFLEIVKPHIVPCFKYKLGE